MEQEPHYILIGVDHGTLVIDAGHVVNATAERSYTRIHLLDGKEHFVCWNLGRLEEALPTHGFFRCHDSSIINLRQVVKLHNHEGHVAEMTNGARVRIARRWYKDLLAALAKGGGG